VDVLTVEMLEIGEPRREHEIERTTQPAREPITVPERREVELPDPALPTPEREPVKEPAR